MPMHRFLDSTNEIKEQLGDHYTANPIKPASVKKKKVKGDPEAFHTWIRNISKKHRGKHMA